MPDEPKKPEEGKGNAILDFVAKTFKLEWIRPLIYNLGGRKLAVGGGGLAVISQIVASGPMDWPKAIACVAVAIVSVGTSFAIASEDKAEKEANAS
jgi:hypothetical protein